MKKVLVTGGFGFMAGYLISRLKRMNFQVYDFTLEDDPLDISHIEFDYIFHLASIARTNECLDDGLNLAYNSNVELTRVLLNNFKFNHFIYASSCAIYGNQNEFPITEENYPNPPSMYAAQKLFSENMTHLHLSHLGISSVCLRLFNTYGIGQSQRGKYPNVLASLIRTYKEKNFIEVTGDGTQTRDFIHVEDVVNAFIKSMNIEEGNHIFNVCSGREISLNNLSSMITDNVKYISERKFDIYRQVASYDKIYKCLGWEPTKNLEDEVVRLLKHESVM